MNLYQYHTDPKKLDLHDVAHDIVPELVWKRHFSKPEELKKREKALAKNAKYAYLYAWQIIKGPFPAGEAAIAKDAEFSEAYAEKVLKGPFPKGEAAIAKDGFQSFMYAKYVLNGPFPAGEEAMKNSEWWDPYKRIGSK